MTQRQRATPAIAARIAVAGVIIAGGALAMAGQAGADPEVPPYPTPVPADPGAPPPPGQPVLICGRTHGCARAATRRPANSPRDRKPRIRLRQIWVGSARHPQGSLASGPGPVSIR